MTSGVALLVLGPVEARGPSGPVPISGSKLQALMALLALSAPGSVTDGRLIDELWGDDRLSNPSYSLHSQIAILRRAIGRDIVVRQGLGCALAVGPTTSTRCASSGSSIEPADLLTRVTSAARRKVSRRRSHWSEGRCSPT